MSEKTKKKAGKPGGGTPMGGPIRSLKRPLNPKKLTVEVMDRLVQAVRDGDDLRAVCKELNISYNTFANWLKEPNPVGLVLQLQVTLGRVALSKWQEAKPKLEAAAEQAATETRIEETVTVTRLIGFNKEITSTLLEIGGEELIEEFAACLVVLKEEKRSRTILPDGSLALRILKEQERRDEKEAAEIQKAAGADGTGRTVVVRRKPGSPGVQPKED